MKKANIFLFFALFAIGGATWYFLRSNKSKSATTKQANSRENTAEPKSVIPDTEQENSSTNSASAKAEEWRSGTLLSKVDNSHIFDWDNTGIKYKINTKRLTAKGKLTLLPSFSVSFVEVITISDFSVPIDLEHLTDAGYYANRFNKQNLIVELRYYIEANTFAVVLYDKATNGYRFNPRINYKMQ